MEIAGPAAMFTRPDTGAVGSIVLGGKAFLKTVWNQLRYE
jgi:hypothetical protein